MTAHQPIVLAASVALIAIIGGGVAMVGLLLLAVAAGAVGFLDPAGGVLGMVGLLGLVAVGAAIVVFVFAAGLWKGRGWAWAGSLATAVAAVIGAVVAIDAAGPQAPVQAGLVLSATAVALLLTRQTREAAGLA